MLTPRRIGALACALALTAPASAFGQAGDDQYTDPFAEEPRAQAQGPEDDGSGLSDAPPTSGGGSGSNSGSSGSGGGSGSSGQGSSAGSSGAGEVSPAPPQGAQGGQLPNTGSDPRLLALFGTVLLLIGLGLRLRTADDSVF